MITKKICLLGDFSVGKTSLVAQFVHQTFSEKYLTTVGVKIDSKQVELENGKTVKLVIWDIAGSDEFSVLEKNYLRGAAGIFLVADGTRPETIESALKLKQVVKDSEGDLPMVCAINKADLTSQWEVGKSDLDPLISSQIEVFKTSAKTGGQVEAAFHQLSKAVATQ